MLENVFICECEEKECCYEFITNSTEYLECPSCGSENVTGHLRKAHVFDSAALTSFLNSDDAFKNKVSEWLAKVNSNISDYLSLKSFLNAWFESNDVKKPETVSFDIHGNFDFCEEGEDYFSGISFEGSEDLEFEVLEDLEDYIRTNYTIRFLKELEELVL